MYVELRNRLAPEVRWTARTLAEAHEMAGSCEHYVLLLGGTGDSSWTGRPWPGHVAPVRVPVEQQLRRLEREAAAELAQRESPRGRP